MLMIFRFFVARPVDKDTLQRLKGHINSWQINNGGVVSTEGDFTYIVCEGGENSRACRFLESLLNALDYLSWEKLALSEKNAYEHARNIYLAKIISTKKQRLAKQA